MKNFRTALILAAATFAAVASAQQSPATARTFGYTSAQAVSADYSNAPASFRMGTKVMVTPYLYVSGNLGAEWTVTGWGAGESTKSETISILHNETLTFVFSDMGDLKKTDGTRTGSQTIGLQTQFQCLRDSGDKLILDSGLIPAVKLNGSWGPIDTRDSHGKLVVVLTRKITLDPGVGPGAYENVGTLTITRN